MVPKHFVSIERLPLTVNGKIDVSALPSPTGHGDSVDRVCVPPSTDTEVALVEIWRQVLRRDDLGIHDNFFELGGASLQALQAADLATRQGYAVSAERMFQYQTIAELAAELDASSFPPPDERAGDPSRLARRTPRLPAPACTTNGQPHKSGPRLVVESLGVYLPPETVSTREVVAGCQNRLDFPLEKMTGIESRQMAGREEFSIDLALHAAADCLSHSRFRADEIDLLIACNISRYDGPEFEISYEPSTASKLKHRIGAASAIAFDICNACAGFFTALAVAESMLLSGRVRRAMIVSGEYITHLTKTAQREIQGFLDPRLACLTLGDAGAAVIVELTEADCGFETLDLYTSGRHHDLCVAKATDQTHGGAIMLTDAIKASAVTLDHSVAHAHRVLQDHRWNPDDVQHLIMHQTSSTTLDGAIEELNRHFGRTVSHRENTVNNLARRGNTASTTHWVAVMDLIRQGRIRSGDKAVFAISGSGQTIGTALYRFDHLPERIRHPGRDHVASPTADLPRAATCGVEIVAVAVERVTDRGGRSEGGTAETEAESTVEFTCVKSARSAAEACITAAHWQPDEVQTLVHCGVYRDEFLSEPAVAAILAGELKLNDAGPKESGKRTLAFDLSAGGTGPLAACQVVAAMMRSGRTERALVTASEVENNKPENRRGVAELGSAIALRQVDDSDVGFGEFFFRSYPQHACAFAVSTRLRRGKPELAIRRSDDLADVMLRCITQCVTEFLAESDTMISDYGRILVSVSPGIGRQGVADAIGASIDQIDMASQEADDAFTSALAVIWKSLGEEYSTSRRKPWLLVAAGSGIDVVCVPYRHR
jgi:3-oxoacyl-[acyl-carrier-protein] synthase III